MTQQQQTLTALHTNLPPKLTNRPKQREAIGEEDFYYEETEVDETTYLAIFNTRNHLPLSPSHNSDGLSSGQSFASSSPATSPVCSTDSSSSASSSSSAAAVACLTASSSSAASSAASSSVLSANGRHGLYATSMDWNHFLADHTDSFMSATPTATTRRVNNYIADSYGADAATFSTSNNHLKQQYLSHQFFHNQSTSSHQTKQLTPKQSKQKYINSNGNNSNNSTGSRNNNGNNSNENSNKLKPNYRSRPLDSSSSSNPQKDNRRQHQTRSPKLKLYQKKQQLEQTTNRKQADSNHTPSSTANIYSITPGGRGKIRGENKKCRKVYGMEQREKWCTQCKWKKACRRFFGEQHQVVA